MMWDEDRRPLTFRRYMKWVLCVAAVVWALLTACQPTKPTPTPTGTHKDTGPSEDTKNACLYALDLGNDAPTNTHDAAVEGAGAYYAATRPHVDPVVRDAILAWVHTGATSQAYPYQLPIDQNKYSAGVQSVVLGACTDVGVVHTGS